MARVQAARRTRRRRRAGDELREAILRAASEVFLEAGYQGASLEAVIDRVGGSKRAIYSHFGSKKALFAALVREASNQAVEPLSAQAVESQDLEDMLQAFGMQVTRVLMSPTTLALYRVVMAESARFPDVAREFFDNGPGRASASLARVLNRFKRAGTHRRRRQPARGRTVRRNASRRFPPPHRPRPAPAAHRAGDDALGPAGGGHLPGWRRHAQEWKRSGQGAELCGAVRIALRQVMCPAASP